MNIHHIGLISGFPMRVGWYGVLSPESWPASFRMIFPFKKKTLHPFQGFKKHGGANLEVPEMLAVGSVSWNPTLGEP